MRYCATSPNQPPWGSGQRMLSAGGAKTGLALRPGLDMVVAAGAAQPAPRVLHRASGPGEGRRRCGQGSETGKTSGNLGWPRATRSANYCRYRSRDWK